MNTKTFSSWIPIATLITFLSFLVMGASQQIYRTLMDDPQTQLVHDGAFALAHGEVPAQIVPRGQLIDIQYNLAPFIAIYDKTGKPLEASGTLYSKPPQPPLGLFDYTRAQGKHRVSWQPEPGVRIALVMQYVPEKDWFVVAGRNMQEAEQRMRKLALSIVFGWMVTLIAYSVAHFIFARSK
jgi:hypothetical protein